MGLERDMVISAVSNAMQKARSVATQTQSKMNDAIEKAKEAASAKLKKTTATTSSSYSYADVISQQKPHAKPINTTKNDNVPKVIRDIEGMNLPTSSNANQGYINGGVYKPPILQIPSTDKISEESKNNINNLVEEAVASDEYIDSLNRIPQNFREIEGLNVDLSAAEARSDELWFDVGIATTAEIYDSTIEESFPIDHVQDVEGELISLYPDNERYVSTVQTAADINVAVWQSEGRTHEVLDPFFEAVENDDWDQVGEILQEQYHLVPSLNPTIEAVEQHTDILQTYGPDSARFRNLVQNQETDVLLTQPNEAAEAISEAGTIFDKAEELRDRTDPGETNPVTAALILEQSQTDINQITEFLSEETHWGGISEELYADLNAAIDSGSRSPVADPIVESTAEQIANIQHPTSINTLRRGITESVGNGDGVVLSLAIADSLNENGRSEEANRVIQDVTSGLEDLEEKVGENVQGFALQIEPFIAPNLAWSNYVGQENANDALQTILNDPDNEKAFEGIASYLENTISPDGYQVVRAIAGLERYESELAGLQSAEELNEVGERFRQDDGALQFAASQADGTLETIRFFNEFNEAQGNFILSGSTIGNENREDVGVRNSRNLVRSLAKLNVNGAPKFDAIADPSRPTGIAVNGIGVGTYAWSASEIFSSEDRSAIDNLYGVHYSVGFVKEIIEVASGSYVAAGNISPNLQINSSSGFWQSVDQQANQIGQGLDDTPWKKFSTRFSIAGVAIDSLNAAQFISQGDYVKATGSGFSVAGGAIPLIFSNSTWAGPVGAGLSIIGTGIFFGKNHYDNVQHNNRLEEPTADFLRLADPDIDPALAGHLGNHTGDGQGITPALDTLAQTLNISEQEIYNWFVDTNESDPDFIPYFIERGIHNLRNR